MTDDQIIRESLTVSEGFNAVAALAALDRMAARVAELESGLLAATRPRGQSAKDELVSKLNALHGDADHESAHAKADDLLIEFIGDAEIKTAYEGTTKWYA